MIRWSIEQGLKFRLLTIALALILIVIGFIQLQNMPVDALPEFAPPFIDIQTEAPGLSTPEVEELVTFNLEELLNGTPWLQSIRSTSVPGLSAITLTFQPGTDILRARQLVSERLSLSYALPNVSQSPVILQPRSALSRVMMVGLTSKQVSPVDMSVLAYWNIRPALLSVPGVANVAIWGLRYKELQVEADPQILQANKVTLDQIISTTGNALWVSPLSFLNASTPGSGGWIDTPQQRIEVRHVLPISTPHDLAQITIEDSKLNLGNVTSIIVGYPPLIGDDIVNNGGGLLVLIDKYPGANTLDVTHKIEDKLAELQPGLSGININKTIFRPAGFVESMIGNFSTALAIGFILLFFTLLLLMRSLSAVLICLVNIAVSFALTISILNFCSVTINLMVLAGLMMAITIITDEVIIDVEKLFLLPSENDLTTSSSAIILLSVLKNRSGMFYATIIILLTLLPIFYLSGIAGSFFQPLAMTYALAVIVSMLVAWFITPSLCLLLLSKQANISQKGSVFTTVERHYQTSLVRFYRSLSRSMLATCAIVLAMLSLIALLLFISFKNPPILPGLKEQNLLVQWEGPPGTSVEEMVRITNRVSRELHSIAGVENVAVEIGRAVLGDKIVNANHGELIVSISSKADYRATIHTIQKVVAGYPGIFHVVQTYLKERTQQILTGTPNDIVVRIFGHDFADLHSKAEEIKHMLSQIKGTTNINVDQQIEQPEIAIQVNLAQAQQYGLKPGDIRRAAATLIGGLQVGSLFDEQKIFPVVVWGTSNLRNSVNGIRNLLIDTPNGKWVRLGEVADVSIKPLPNFIQHDTVSRSLDVGVDVRGRSANAVVNEIKENLKNISFPLEYRAEVLGIYQQQAKASQHLLVTGIAIVLLIFLLMQAIFDSFLLAALVFFTLPFALIGSVLLAIIIGSSSSIALTGMFAVFAITIRNTIMSIMDYQTISPEKTQINEELLFSAASERSIPVILTGCAVIVALLPFIILFNRPGLEIAGPVAVIIIGGIITSIIYTGLIVPALYLGFGKSK